MFGVMAPRRCKCFAGHYRGSRSCEALLKYEVHLVGPGADPRVGKVAASEVAAEMAKFEAMCAKLWDAFQATQSSEEPKAADDIILFRLVRLLAQALERIFLIHPYANGNGHAGRYLVMYLLAKAGFATTKWSIDDKQPYGDALTAYRDGHKEPLEDFLLDALAAG